MSEPKYLIVFPDCLVAPGCKTVGTWTLSRVTGHHVALSSCCAWFLAPGATGGPRLLFNRIGDVMRFRASAHESPARLNPMTSRFRLNPIAATTISGSINQEYYYVRM